LRLDVPGRSPNRSTGHVNGITSSSGHERANEGHPVIHLAERNVLDDHVPVVPPHRLPAIHWSVVPKVRFSEYIHVTTFERPGNPERLAHDERGRLEESNGTLVKEAHAVKLAPMDGKATVMARPIPPRRLLDARLAFFRR
jgi:hypothetical protein